MKNDANGGNGEWVRSVLEKIEDHMHRIDNAVASGEKRHAENEARWQSLLEFIHKSDERWQMNEERWQKNDRRIARMIQTLERHTAELADIKKRRS